jgi:hypothetical protein
MVLKGFRREMGRSKEETETREKTVTKTQGTRKTQRTETLQMVFFSVFRVFGVPCVFVPCL